MLANASTGIPSLQALRDEAHTEQPDWEAIRFAAYCRINDLLVTVQDEPELYFLLARAVHKTDGTPDVKLLELVLTSAEAHKTWEIVVDACIELARAYHDAGQMPDRDRVLQELIRVPKQPHVEPKLAARSRSLFGAFAAHPRGSRAA